MKALEALQSLNACQSGIDEVKAAASFRVAWESLLSTSYMAWLIAHTLPRARLVRVAVRCAETCAHLAPPECLPLLADVSAWANGEKIDIYAVRDRLWAARYAADAIIIGDRALVRAARAAWEASRYDVAAAAADASYATVWSSNVIAVAASDAVVDVAKAATSALHNSCIEFGVFCDVIRDEVDADEICAAMGIDPDAVTS